MRRRLLNSYLLVLLALLLLNGCRSSKNIEVRDDSIISTSKSEFFANLNNSLDQKASVSSYLSKKVTISSDDIPLYSTLNMQLYLRDDNYMVSKVYTPFPVLEVLKMKYESGSVIYESKMMGINNSKSFPNEFISFFKYCLIGSVPKAYLIFGDTDFSKFSLYVQNNKYVLSRSNSSLNLSIYINSDYTLSSITADYTGGLSFNAICQDYSFVDGYNIPKKLSFDFSSNTHKIKADLSIKNILINSQSKIDY